MDTGELPDIWKIAHVTPIYKKGSKSEPLNYRPVSLTAILCKVMEKIIRNASVEYMTNNRMFTTHQHGFRSNRSCLTQMLEYFLEVHEFLDEGNVLGVDAVYLDCKKAFDTVPHKRLIKKLEAYGFGGKILRWIKNFLSNRTQRVSIKGVLSDPLPVESGVPQGSVLGPLLFLIYINDLLEGIESNGKLFADDAKLFKQIKSPNDRDILQRDLLRLQQWSRKWLLEFNEDKCKIMHISLRDTNPRFNYFLNEKELDKSQSEKDLGIHVAENWQPSVHIAKIVSRANRALGQIRRTFTFMNKTIFLNVYPSFVRSHLEYAVQVWSPSLKKDINQLEKVQRRATKLVHDCKELEYEQRLAFLGLTTLEERRVRGDLIEVFKIMHGYDDLRREKFFILESEIHTHHTRGHNLKIASKRSRTENRRRNFDIRTIDKWNQLPENIVYSNNISSFKIAYDNWINE